MAHTPLLLSLFFLLTTLVAVFFITKATNNSRVFLFVCSGWLALQSVIALTGFYTITNILPPRFLLAIGPPVLAIVIFFFTAGGKGFLNSIDLKWATLLHSVRMLVEINLYFLYIYKQASVLLSIEGGNVDFFAGLTAPIIWWAYSKGHVGRKGLLIWNFICLASVGNAVVRAMLSAPFPFQRFGFDQPTVGILYFPYILLPAFIVPCVLLSHVAVIRKLVGHHI
jgi:hypothetical protein